MTGRISLRRLLARLGVLVVLATGMAIASAGPATADPSQYCRSQVGTPYLSVYPKYQGNGEYTLSITTYVNLNCNGTINSSSVIALLHYTLNGGSDHIKQGTAKGCIDSCEASSTLTETFDCGDYNYMSFHGAITGWWKQTSTSAKINLSGTGATYNDSWTDGNGVCP